MNPMLKPALILLLLTSVACKINPDERTGWCKYYNDPHIIEFASSPDAEQNQYLCRNNCTQIMVKNEFLEIIVTPDPQGDYPIVEYTVIFFATAAYSQPCVITNVFTNGIAYSSTGLSCQSGSPADNTYISPTAQTYTHFDESIEVEISQRGNWFNILVTQSFDLIQQSTGVCVKSNCEPEKNIRRKKREDSFSAIISQIIDVFFKAALEKSSGDIHPSLLAFLRTAVTYDMSTTFNQRYAETIAVSIAQENARPYRSQDDYGKNLEKADRTAQQVICQAGEQANKIIGSQSICKGEGKARKCLQSINYSAQCQGGRRKRNTSDARSFFH